MAEIDYFEQGIPTNIPEKLQLSPTQIAEKGWQLLEEFSGLREMPVDEVQTFCHGLGWSALTAQEGLGYGVGLADGLLEVHGIHRAITAHQPRQFYHLAVAQLIVPPESTAQQIIRRYVNVAKTAGNSKDIDTEEAPGLQVVLDSSVFPFHNLESEYENIFAAGALEGYTAVRSAYDTFREGDRFFDRYDFIQQAGGMVVATNRMINDVVAYVKEQAS